MISDPLSGLDLAPLLGQLHEDQPISLALSIDYDMITPQLPVIWQAMALSDLHTLPFSQRFDVALLNLHQTDWPSSSLMPLITRLRDLLARRVLVLAAPGHTLLLRSLGFSQLEPLNESLVIWQFNILSYKHTPDWLNAKYWANPENWGKYRW